MAELNSAPLSHDLPYQMPFLSDGHLATICHMGEKKKGIEYKCEVLTISPMAASNTVGHDNEI